MLQEEDFDNYDKVKEFILKQHRITQLQHKKNFDFFFKFPGDSYDPYATPVEAYWESWNYTYLKCREVETLEKQKELSIVDNIKEMFPVSAIPHVFLKETEQLFLIAQLIREIDNFLLPFPKNPISFYSLLS